MVTAVTSAESRSASLVSSFVRVVLAFIQILRLAGCPLLSPSTSYLTTREPKEVPSRARRSSSTSNRRWRWNRHRFLSIVHGPQLPLRKSISSSSAAWNAIFRI